MTLQNMKRLPRHLRGADSSEDRRASYRALVDLRKKCALCAGLTNPSNIEGGSFDSEHIGPWTTWQGNLGASVMLIGQDYSDVRYFLRNRGREGAGNPTDLTLVQLMAELGVALTPPGYRNAEGETFFTNAILCLKQDGMQAKVQTEWFRNCQPFLRRQVEIVAPRVVVAMGEKAFRNTLAAFDKDKAEFGQAVLSPDGIVLPNGSLLFAVYHCGRRVQNMTRSRGQQIEDWRRIARALNAHTEPRQNPGSI